MVRSTQATESTFDEPSASALASSMPAESAAPPAAETVSRQPAVEAEANANSPTATAEN